MASTEDILDPATNDASRNQSQEVDNEAIALIQRRVSIVLDTNSKMQQLIDTLDVDERRRNDSKFELLQNATAKLAQIDQLLFDVKGTRLSLSTTTKRRSSEIELGEGLEPRSSMNLVSGERLNETDNELQIELTEANKEITRLNEEMPRMHRVFRDRDNGVKQESNTMQANAIGVDLQKIDFILGLLPKQGNDDNDANKERNSENDIERQIDRLITRIEALDDDEGGGMKQGIIDLVEERDELMDEIKERDDWIDKFHWLSKASVNDGGKYQVLSRENAEMEQHLKRLMDALAEKEVEVNKQEDSARDSQNEFEEMMHSFHGTKEELHSEYAHRIHVMEHEHQKQIRLMKEQLTKLGEKKQVFTKQNAEMDHRLMDIDAKAITMNSLEHREPQSVFPGTFSQRISQFVNMLLLSGLMLLLFVVLTASVHEEAEERMDDRPYHVEPLEKDPVHQENEEIIENSWQYTMGVVSIGVFSAFFTELAMNQLLLAHN